MSENKPNGLLDRIAQDIASLRQEVRRLALQVVEQEKFNVKMLQTLQRGEETFELRVARAQFNVFNHVAHSLEHTIEAYQNQLSALYRGFDVEVVNGETVVENAESVVVRKREGGYDYSRAVDPDVIQNEGTEIFSKYFDENPQVFGDRTEIMVNISTHLNLDKEVPADDKA